MATTKRQHLLKQVQRVFKILLDYPEGLSSKGLWEQLALSAESGNGNANASNNKHNGVPTFEELSFACVGPIKAGWLMVAGNRWVLTEEGKQAYENFATPRQLMLEAGKKSAQGWLAVNFPRTYSTAGKTKDQLRSEVRTIRRVGISRLLKEMLGKPTKWRELLPLQSPRSIAIAGMSITSTESLFEYLRTAKAVYAEGSHAIYLPPDSLSQTAFSSVMEDYPADAGLKIMKNQGDVDESNYVVGRAKGDSRIQLGMIEGHRYLSLVANLLCAEGVGPRLYDLVNLKFAAGTWAAYVVQDVGGRWPSDDECKAGVDKLRRLDAEGIVKVILPEGFNDEEFECPKCCNNALVDIEGQFKYIDFQNFLLGDYEKYLTALASEAAAQTHFGDTAMLRGGRYLYQSVPGVKLPAKRSVANRMTTLTKLLQQAGVSVNERLVLDIGCNIGMMMAEYLKAGAKWCHGWDRALTVRHTERILLALGCTRFSTTGTDITQAQPISTDLPEHVARSLEGCVISYLAVRGHLNWLDALGEIPWSFMIYEGHEGEVAQDFEVYLKELRALTNFEVGPVASYVDGDSDERQVAIILRRP